MRERRDKDRDATMGSSCSSELVLLSHALGHVLARDVTAKQNIPDKKCSMMDGYAVREDDLVVGKNEKEEDQVVLRIMGEESLAGEATPKGISSGDACYITTGAVLPLNADLVVPVEQTEELTREREGERLVRIRGVKSLHAGKFVRQIGSDIKNGQVVLRTGLTLKSAEIGILAQLGVAKVHVFKRPVVAIMSTGNELVDYSAPMDNSKNTTVIRDCNRIMLQSCLREMNLGAQIIDYGIIKDNRYDVENALKQAIRHADIVITSGGVSMGDKDYVKPILEEIATVHFGRVRMKPGKPTTFATTELMDSKKLIFALPGNPVSAKVSYHLFVEPALHFMSGNESWHHPLLVTTVTHDIRMDPVRTEYHRCRVAWDAVDQKLLSRSTGHQQSSRLLSTANSNGLLIIPQGEGRINSGSKVKTLLTDLPQRLTSDELKEWMAVVSGAADGHHHHHHHHGTPPPDSSKIASAHERPLASQEKTIFNVAIITVSDRVHRGEMQDKSMPEMQKFFDQQNSLEGTSTLWEVMHTAVVPDESKDIRDKLIECCDREHVHLVLTTGGTGFSPRDITPDVTLPLLTRRADQLTTACMVDGLNSGVPTAMLSRAVAGIRDNTLIINLPGSSRGVKQNLETLMKGRLEHALKLMISKPTEH
eukprot:CAMPEP_0117449294 /NCGR_PEP_ID=MMETSP0759-20121206/7871_1 /TAXON_ID=63605 /ORGANISM="Percolomonas cosmopolitus, Strain WS" /LENGTH=649 /DNA_ID=CAMNT_0005241765 /DNA_START=945 /DNA_END=2894 /DNA_ORIENTATION=+